MTRARQWLRGRRPAGEDGMSLLELMIGMVVMTVLMTICTGAVVTMFASTGKTQAIDNSAQQLNTAFVRLDKQVRYAVAIDQPTGSTATDDVSVAFKTVSLTGATCTQLRIRSLAGTDQQQLVERSWPVSSTGTPGAASGWNQLASGVIATDSAGAVVTPFSVSTPLGGAVQQLRLKLGAVDKQGKAPTQSFSTVVFSALNSGSTTAAITGGSTAVACPQTGIS